PLLKAASIVAYEHHEKWDGTGYPRGSSGEDIHIYGRITAIADVFDALGSDRVYKKAWNDEKILNLFREERGKHFDPALIDMFFENIDAIFEVRETFKDEYIEEPKQEIYTGNSIKILGAYGTKAKGFGTSSFSLNETNVIDAGNLLAGLGSQASKIQNIWITHSHLDHISDIAYVIDNYFDDFKGSINIHALPQTIETLQKHFLNDLVWPDFSKIKLSNSKEMCVSYIAIELDKEYKLSDKESIKAFKTDHTVPSCGYIYKKENSAVLITADTYSLDNIVEIIDKDFSIKSIVIECSIPSRMEELAKESKHLTPSLLAEKLKSLQRTDLELYINHIKPLYLEEMTQEINECCGAWKPKILKDGEIIKF
ncbi:MAG: diguanylate cyclase, partial [Sulfurimonas sp.]|nr:diguanylate cyclase [Sulfurimonas sp.]